MSTVFLALSTFSNISNVIRGRLLEHLAKKYKVIVLTQYLDAKTAAEYGYPASSNIEYFKLPQKYPGLWGFFNAYLRTPFIRRFDDLLAVQTWEYRKNVSMRLRLLNSIGRIFPKSFPTADFFTYIESLIVRPSKEFTGLIKKYDPKLLITATPGFNYGSYEAELLIFSKKIGIPSAAIDMSFDNPYSQAKFVRKTDYAIVWNDRMKNETVAMLGFRPDKVFAAGCLKFDHYFNDIKDKKIRPRDEFLRLKGLNPNKKTIVYATPTPGTYPPRRELMEKFVNWKKEGKLSGSPNIIVRLHPLDVWKPYEEFLNIPEIHIERAGTSRLKDSSKDAKVEMTDHDLINLTETMKYCDAFVNFASTMIVEACIFNTPSVSIGFPKEQKPFVDFELTRDIVIRSGELIAESPEELLGAINKLLTEKQTEADLERDKKTVEEFVQFTDGLSWKRTADLIDAIVSEQK